MSLCRQCYELYRRKKLPVFVNPQTKAVSITRFGGWLPYYVEEFPTRPDGPGLDFQNPVIKPIYSLSYFEQGLAIPRERGLGTVARCAVCNTTDSAGWVTGPDGPRTLCDIHGREYERGKLFVYRRPDGTLTMQPTPGAEKCIVTGFEPRGRGEMRDHEKPVVKKADDQLGPLTQQIKPQLKSELETWYVPDLDDHLSPHLSANQCNNVEPSNDTLQFHNNQVIPDPTLRQTHMDPKPWNHLGVGRRLFNADHIQWPLDATVRYIGRRGRIKIPHGIKYRDLLEGACQAVGINDLRGRNIQLKYMDYDRDWITIGDRFGLKVMFCLVKGWKFDLQFVVVDMDEENLKSNMKALARPTISSQQKPSAEKTQVQTGLFAASDSTQSKADSTGEPSGRPIVRRLFSKRSTAAQSGAEHLSGTYTPTTVQRGLFGAGTSDQRTVGETANALSATGLGILPRKRRFSEAKTQVPFARHISARVGKTPGPFVRTTGGTVQRGLFGAGISSLNGFNGIKSGTDAGNSGTHETNDVHTLFPRSLDKDVNGTTNDGTDLTKEETGKAVNEKSEVVADVMNGMSGVQVEIDIGLAENGVAGMECKAEIGKVGDLIGIEKVDTDTLVVEKKEQGDVEYYRKNTNLNLDTEAMMFDSAKMEDAINGELPATNLEELEMKSKVEAGDNIDVEQNGQAIPGSNYGGQRIRNKERSESGVGEDSSHIASTHNSLVPDELSKTAIDVKHIP